MSPTVVVWLAPALTIGGVSASGGVTRMVTWLDEDRMPSVPESCSTYVPVALNRALVESAFGVLEGHGARPADHAPGGRQRLRG
jgi:hypothetical protein